MLVLAFDTATPAVTVALHDGTAVLATVTSVDARRHGELLAPGIGAALRETGMGRHDLTEIGVGVGPGPFTGLRVGLVTARSLGYALDIPVHGVCTLDILAFEYGRDEPFVVATDARRGEVYWARYAEARQRRTDPAVSRPNDVDADGVPVVGQGAVLYPQAFPEASPPTYPSAAALAALVVDRVTAGAAPIPPEPLYLRRPDARLPGPRKQVTPA
ncbi:MAG: tRNA (adenosine(37)-N6)-threonylcarbamoyltransferase complex dimerization subunit type 1 TsaB [Streptosporangiaceae bacterium]